MLQKHPLPGMAETSARLAVSGSLWARQTVFLLGFCVLFANFVVKSGRFPSVQNDPSLHP
jgi:hypothetical protein